MQKYQVFKDVEAYVRYSKFIEASSEAEALDKAMQFVDIASGWAIDKVYETEEATLCEVAHESSPSEKNENLKNLYNHIKSIHPFPWTTLATGEDEKYIIDANNSPVTEVNDFAPELRMFFVAITNFFDESFFHSLGEAA